MLELRDRIYGNVQLPDRARRLASTCPALLRLREIRMPNIGFVTFPSFASVTRFEHSVGVSHLAWWWARRNNIDAESAEALAIAGLYHDAATPAFSHLFEEFLQRYGFDHETELTELLTGGTKLTGSEHAQIFLGGTCLIPQVLPEPSRPDSPLTSVGIADLATGASPLGQVLHGRMDLDNIDNVIRAVTSMGLVTDGDPDAVHPYEVADALSYENGKICVSRNNFDAVGRWQNLRRRLYAAIIDSEVEFRTQATIKWAISKCAEKDDLVDSMQSWTLSEPELIERLRRYEFSKLLIDQVRLNNPARLILSAWVSDISRLLGPDSGKIAAFIAEEIGHVLGEEVYVNFYVDKRERKLGLPHSSRLTLFQEDLWDDQELVKPEEVVASGTHDVAGILGVVALPSRVRRPHGENVGYATNSTGQIDLREAARVLKQNLGVAPDRVDRRWIGTSGRRSPGDATLF
jgi:HD superfamily phosphohydrolase